jgi:hypothetical protein
MEFGENLDTAYVRWGVEDEEVRATARRQLAFCVPTIIAGVFVAAIYTFGVGHADADSHAARQAPHGAPATHSFAIG